MITIEKASVEQISTLVEFQRNLALETEDLALDTDTLRKGMAALFEDPSKGIYFTVWEDARIIGCYMITYEWSDWRNGTVVWLQSVYVIESHRKKGIFRKMYNHLANMVASNDEYKGIRLYVDKSNARAMKVYQAMGMNGDHYTIFERMD